MQEMKSYILAGFTCVSLILFLVLNFTLGAPSEYCWGSDNCVINCVPSSAVLTAMCCGGNCSPTASSNQCIQTYTSNGITTSCSCLESMQCIFTADSRFSNLAWLFLLLCILTLHHLLSNSSSYSFSKDHGHSHGVREDHGHSHGVTEDHGHSHGVMA